MPETNADTLRVRLERLKSHVEELAQFGRNESDGALYRTAFSDADLEARRWLIRKLEALGLPAQMDGAGNVKALLKGSGNRPRLVVGSHTDTVPRGGALDGSLGVLSALECLQTLMDANWMLERDIELVAFSDEEGRFGGMFGSEAYCGKVTPERLEYYCEAEEQTLRQAMQQQGMDPEAALSAGQDPSQIAGYLELHIEQGPVLHLMGKQVGIVQAITGLFKWRVCLVGQSNHAGTTPMNLRQDALMGLAEFAFSVSRVLEEYGTEESRATIGRAQILPGAANTVPGFVEFTLDVRDPNPEILRELEQAFARSLRAICQRRSLGCEREQQSWIPPVSCDPEMVALLESSARKRGLQAHCMNSGAAHDAQIMANLTRIGMIFVPSKAGLSHDPGEHTEWSDIEAGANLMLEMILQMDAKVV